MGRLTTSLAAAIIDAENLPPRTQLPKISLIDALLPSGLTNFALGQKKPMRKQQMPSFIWPPVRLVDAETGKPVNWKVGYSNDPRTYEVKKNGKGQKYIVAHKGNSSSNKGTGKADGAKQKNESNRKAEKGGDETKKLDDPEWTRAEDNKLRAMKGENKTWKEIGAEMNKPLPALRARFKVIKDSNAGEGTANAAKNKGNSLKNEAAKKSQQDKQTTYMHGGRTDINGPRKAPSHAASSRSGDARFTMDEWLTLQEDDRFDFAELQLLSELIMRMESQTWERVAAAFFDKTGRRIHPDDIRDKFEGY